MIDADHPEDKIHIEGGAKEVQLGVLILGQAAVFGVSGEQGLAKAGIIRGVDTVTSSVGSKPTASHDLRLLAGAQIQTNKTEEPFTWPLCPSGAAKQDIQGGVYVS